MARKKPTAVFVFGILQIVFGSMSVAWNLCCGIGAAGIYLLLRNLYQQAPPEAQQELDEVARTFLDNVPGLIPFLIGSLVVSMLLGIVQVVDGIGLVKIRNWARWLCVAWAVVEIAVVAGGLFYQIAILSPGSEKAAQDLERWMDRMEEKQRRKGMAPAPRQKISTGTGNPVVDNLLSIAMSLFSLGYAALAAVFMILPGTGQAVARYNSPEDEFGPPGGPQDYYDEEFERRRRSLEPPPGEATGPPPAPEPPPGPPPAY